MKTLHSPHESISKPHICCRYCEETVRTEHVAINNAGLSIKMLCVNAVLQIIFLFFQFVCFIWLQIAAEYPVELPFLSSDIVDHSSLHAVVRDGFLAFKKNNLNTFIQNIILFLFFRLTPLLWIVWIYYSFYVIFSME